MSTSKKYLLGLICLIITSSSFAQTRQMVGNVSAFNSYPIAKAAIFIKGSKDTVVSDTLGFFQLSCTQNDKIVVMANGFSTQTVNANSYKDSILVNLVFKGGDKNIKIATGFGHIDEKKLTYAVGHLKDENFKKEYYATIFDMLKSKCPGVQVDGQIITVRGTNVMSVQNGPLLVVDGFVVDYNIFKNLEPQSVKSIDVLKDGASSALYGSRGMNGVIVVCLKKTDS